MTDAEFLAAFEDCTLPAAEWTHRAHVRMAWICLSAGNSFEAVMAKVRGGIQRLNLVVLGKPEGYHETITYAFLRLIDAALREETADGTFESFCRRHPSLLSPHVLLRYYSKDLLSSPKARREIVSADLAPLP
jgi:hypothetical protein